MAWPGHTFLMKELHYLHVHQSKQQTSHTLEHSRTQRRCFICLVHFYSVNCLSVERSFCFNLTRHTMPAIGTAVDVQRLKRNIFVRCKEGDSMKLSRCAVFNYTIQLLVVGSRHSFLFYSFFFFFCLS